MQDVNRISQDVIKHHSLSRSTLSSSSSQQSIDSESDHSSVSNLPAKLQHLNVAAPASRDTHTSADSPAETTQASRATAADTNNMHSSHKSTNLQLQTDSALATDSSIQQATDGDQVEVAAQSGAETGAAADNAPQQSPMPDQAAALLQPTALKSPQIKVPAISIAGWDESPVSVSSLFCP